MKLMPDAFDEFTTREPPRVADLSEATLAALKSADIAFTGREFPLSVRPLAIPSEMVARIRSTVEELHGVIEKVAVLYSREVEVRRYFGSYRPVRRLLVDLPEIRPLSQVCRFDGILSENGDFKILETNAACPCGVAENGVVMRHWWAVQETWGLIDDMSLDDQPLHLTPHLFVDLLLKAHRRQLGREPESVFIVELRGRFRCDVDWMVKGFRERGVAAHVVDARELRMRERHIVHSAGMSATLVYNSLDQVELIGDPAAREYLPAATSEHVCFLNPLVAQCVLGDKRVLAFITDPRFSDFFSPTERECVARCVPWTRVLEESVTTTPDGSGPRRLIEFARHNRAGLVIKPANRLGGDGVVVGRSTSDSTWRAAVEHALDARGYVVQEYIAPSSFDVLTVGWSRPERMSFGLDTFMFEGRFVGFQSRASRDPVINLRKGGVLVPVVTSHQRDGRRSSEIARGG